VSEQELASNKRPSGKKRFATKAILPRRRKIFFSKKPGSSGSAASTAVFAATRPSRRDFRFQVLMHFSAYLVIAALVIMGLQLAYAFYQLASFVL
jgi:hypothetical protein